MNIILVKPIYNWNIGLLDATCIHIQILFKSVTLCTKPILSRTHVGLEKLHMKFLPCMQYSNWLRNLSIKNYEIFKLITVSHILIMCTNIGHKRLSQLIRVQQKPHTKEFAPVSIYTGEGHCQFYSHIQLNTTEILSGSEVNKFPIWVQSVTAWCVWWPSCSWSFSDVFLSQHNVSSILKNLACPLIHVKCIYVRLIWISPWNAWCKTFAI